MNGDVLLDSSVVIPYFRKDPVIGQRMREGHSLYLPTTVVGELYCGAYLTVNPAKVLSEIRGFLNGVAILTQSDVTADCYGKIRAALAKAGTPIPENDIWIAATAMEHQIPLAVRDRHFSLIDGLKILSW